MLRILLATAAALLTATGSGAAAATSNGSRAAPPATANATPPGAVVTATVAQGALAGTRRNGVTTYLGIPYAAPPVGELRWQPPAAPTAWHGTRAANAFASECQQIPPDGAFRAWTAEYLIAGPVSEDCLYLNVWTPAHKQSARLPVLVWIYGGGFQQGGTTVPVYNGAPLASKGVIVVSINYRLNLFGFMAHPGLSAENPAGASGNYGLLDQVAGLRWVQQNIAAFGGDPARVTVAGQSAGSAAVHLLIGSPLAKGLFHQAIAQSGTDPTRHLPTHADGEASGMQLMQASGAADIAAMRKLSPAQLEAASTRAGSRFGPVVDGRLLPDATYANANTNDAPMLIGMTADEGSSLTSGYGVASPASLRAKIDQDYGSLAGEFATLYPATTDAEAGLAQATLARDNGLAALDLWARRRSARSNKAVYLYLFNHVQPGPESARYKVFHSSELPYVFNTLDTTGRQFTAQDHVLANTISDYWVNFVKTGNPNSGNLTAWPRHTASAPQIMELADPPRARPVLDPAKQSLFERYIQHGGVLRPF
jgi:para-nitrobenzyl esterase